MVIVYVFSTHSALSAQERRTLQPSKIKLFDLSRSTFFWILRTTTAPSEALLLTVHTFYN